MRVLLIILTCLLLSSIGYAAELRGSGDLGVVIERAGGSVLIVEHSNNTVLGRVEGLGDLSHASLVYSRDARYAYIFGRDGGLSKIDILSATLVKRVIQAGNSIGGAISQDGKSIAVSNYKPGGVKIFDADSLDMLHDIPATYSENLRSKVVGLVDAPGNRFVFSLYDADEIWTLDMNGDATPRLTRFHNIGRAPYDGLITPDGRYYIAGLFGDDSLALLDLWHPEKGVRKILDGYAAHDEKLPVYKMPHLEGWAIAGNKAFLPAVGQHKIVVVDTNTWQQIGEIPAHSQPVFVMAQPDGRKVWSNYAFPDNNVVQVIDTESMKIQKTLTVGKGVLHMEFTPRGEGIWLSVRDENRLDIVATDTLEVTGSLPASKPSGIFFTNRAHRIGL